MHAWPWIPLLLIATACLLACAGGEGGASRPGGTPEDPELERRRMVDQQLRRRGIDSETVLAAMARVPRHRFVPAGERRYAYADGALPIGHEQTISQPFVVAFMTEAAELSPGDRVLEIGTGSGYQAAVIAELVGELWSIEIVAPLAERAREALAACGYDRVHLRTGDGYRGWPEEAPFDAILVTAAPDHVPQPLLDQLAVGGRLVIPVGDREQELLRIRRTETGYERQSILPVRFVPMTGEAEERL